jgi:hypothetical protein
MQHFLYIIIIMLTRHINNKELNWKIELYKQELN